MDSVRNVLITVRGIQEISETELEYMESRLPAYRLEKAHRYRRREDRVNSIVSYSLLDYMIRSYYNAELPGEPKYNQYGKPLFTDIGAEVSISHCSGGVCCAVSEKPVGADMENVITDYYKLVSYVLSENEQHLLHEADSPEKLFTEMWTQKEAFLKMKGTGLINKLSDCDVTLFRKKYPELIRNIIWHDETCISVCSYKMMKYEDISIDDLLGNMLLAYDNK